jgi:hypothetical protein
MPAQRHAGPGVVPGVDPQREHRVVFERGRLALRGQTRHTARERRTREEQTIRTRQLPRRVSGRRRLPKGKDGIGHT